MFACLRQQRIRDEKQYCRMSLCVTHACSHSLTAARSQTYSTRDGWLQSVIIPLCNTVAFEKGVIQWTFSTRASIIVFENERKIKWEIVLFLSDAFDTQLYFEDIKWRKTIDTFNSRPLR